MNLLHYPDRERCKKLTEIGAFPKRYGSKQTIFGNYPCPSVMEMLDVIPKTYEGGYFFEMYHDSCRIKRIDPKSPTGWDVMCSFWEKGGILANQLADLIFWLHENNYITF